MDRRTLLEGVAAGALVYSLPGAARAQSSGLAPVLSQVEKHHDESVKRLQEWIRVPSIAAENKAMSEGADLMVRLLKDAGFETAVRVPTEGHPGVFATLDAGAKRTVGVYFMYDVKQVDPAEWTSPPYDAAFVDKPGLGKAIVGRGAVNQDPAPISGSVRVDRRRPRLGLAAASASRTRTKVQGAASPLPCDTARRPSGSGRSRAKSGSTRFDSIGRQIATMPSRPNRSSVTSSRSKTNSAPAPTCPFSARLIPNRGSR